MSEYTRRYNKGELPGAGQVEGEKDVDIYFSRALHTQKTDAERRICPEKGRGEYSTPNLFNLPCTASNTLASRPPGYGSSPACSPNAVSPSPHTIPPANPGMKNPGPGVWVLLPRTRVTWSTFLPFPHPPLYSHFTHTDTLTFSSVSALGLVDSPDLLRAPNTCFLQPGPTTSPHTLLLTELLPYRVDTPAHLCSPRQGRVGLPEVKGEGP